MVGVHVEARLTVLFQGMPGVGPSENAAVEVVDIGMACGDEAAGESGAAVAGGAVNDEGLIGGDTMEQGGCFGFRIDATGFWQGRDELLLGGPGIEDARGWPCGVGEPGGEVGGGDGGHVGEAIAHNFLCPADTILVIGPPPEEEKAAEEKEGKGGEDHEPGRGARGSLSRVGGHGRRVVFGGWSRRSRRVR